MRFFVFIRIQRLTFCFFDRKLDTEREAAKENAP